MLLTGEGRWYGGDHARGWHRRDRRWRWQERIMHEGVDGLLRDKTPVVHPAACPEIAERVVALTIWPAPSEATHWTAPAIGQGGISVSLVQRICGPWLQLRRLRQFKLSNDPDKVIAALRRNTSW